MKVFFNSNHTLPGGPVQVNKNLLACLGNRVVARRDTGRSVGIFHSVVNIAMADVVVFSGLMVRDYEVRLAKKLGKKIIFIMHGCSLLETGTMHPHEKILLQYADLILPVSETFAGLVRETFPEYAHKVKTLANGVDWKKLASFREQNLGTLERDASRIILFGGGRYIKQNLPVCRAVMELNEEDALGLHVDVYGYFRENDDSAAIADLDCVTFHHVIPHDEVMLELLKSGIYVQNSKYETFSLGLADALAMGCDVLFSRNVGAIEIIPGKTSDDIIEETTDVEEIKSKLRNLLTNPNNKRLMDSIDLQSSSIETAADRLWSYCCQLSETKS